MNRTPKPLLLIIMDGVGVSQDFSTSPMKTARIPVLNSLKKEFPFVALQASGTAVGLPWGEAGNSEVGHLTIGAGRTVYHYLPRIISAIADGSFFENPVFKTAADAVKKNNSRLHIAGLVSSGSVHSYIDHVYALLEFARRESLPRVFLHVFTDGKDAPPREASKFLARLEEKITSINPQAKIASVIGRDYALDRSGEWGRVEKSFNLLAWGKGKAVKSLTEYLESRYQEGYTDNAIPPAFISENNGEFEGRIKKGDSLIFSDFREDSMREIIHAFADENFIRFPRENIPNLTIVTMTEYEEGMEEIAAFRKIEIKNTLPEILTQAELTHLHIAETQKYAHITYFLNGGKEEKLKGEERILIPAQKDSPPEKNPQMMAGEITKKIVENFDNYDCILANYANADMVGHSGNFQAAVIALEELDKNLEILRDKVLNSGGVIFLTSDHGNIEKKMDFSLGEKITEHTANLVYFFLIGEEYKLSRPRTEEEIKRLENSADGILSDIAPTMLNLLNIEKPPEMTGKSILPKLLTERLS